MADISRSQSSTKLALPSDRLRYTRFRPHGQSHSIGMDSFVLQTHRAQFEDPIFHPSYNHAFDARLSSHHALAYCDQSWQGVVQQQLDEDSTQNGPRDVQGRHNHIPQLQSQIEGPLPRPRLSRSQLLPSSSLPPSHGRPNYPTSHCPRSLSISGSWYSQPRPVDFCEEADERRSRFALTGGNTQEPAFFSPDSEREPDLLDVNPDSTRHSERTWQSQVASHRFNAHVQFAEQNGIEEIESIDSARGPVQYHVDSSMDDDALAVDDPRWMYDFADFMQRWRLTSFTSESRPSVRCTSRTAHSNNNTGGEIEDIQGILWPHIGVDRSEALSVRHLSHPCRKQQATTIGGKRYKERTSADAVLHYRYRGFTPGHQSRATHYQLRNVLAASNQSDIFYACDSRVMHTSLSCPSLAELALDLGKRNCDPNFRITCLAASPSSFLPDYTRKDILVAGGFYGEFALLALNSDERQSHHGGFITHDHNGLVTHVHTLTDRRSGLPQAVFCSNDSHVRVMDADTLQVTSSWQYVNPINCAASAPDGRLRVLVGDSNHVLITDAEKGDPIIALHGHSDHGFACAWSPDGLLVATGAEDNTVLVWDARNWSSPLEHVQTLSSCPRSVHFTSDNALIVAEDDDVVTIYDRGDFSRYQDVRFFGSIAGVALLDGGKEIVIANADKTVGGIMSLSRISPAS